MLDKSKFLYISLTALIASLLLSFIDGYFSPDYIYKSIIKVIFFITIILIYLSIFKDERNHFKAFYKLEPKNLKISLILGLIVFAIIIIAYLLARNFIDLNQIQAALSDNINVNKSNFIYVALYISLINSFLEETFFRIYAFNCLNNKLSRNFAYIFSSTIFAFYHLGMTDGWFNPIILALSFIGLFIAGSIFNFLSEKTNSIYPSWIVHMFANFAINSIGLSLFGII